MTYRELVNNASEKLAKNGNNPQDAIFLMLELSNKESYDLYLNYDEEVSFEIKNQFEKLLARLLLHEPLQYILGYENFYGYRFIVNENVLIPRDETQELVSNVLADIDSYFKNPTVIDVGCGSGIIGLTLKKEEPSINVILSDISSEAINVAQQNAKNLNVEADFLIGDMLEPFIKNNIKTDILVSNPPYIKQTEILEKSVVDYEPNIALFGGEDGLMFYRKIFDKAHLVLNEKFIMAFEIGYDQKTALMHLSKQYFPNCEIEVLKDINNKDRMLFIYKLN